MRKFLLRLLGGIDSIPPAPSPAPTPRASQTEVTGLRQDVRDLVGSVDNLSGKLDQTVTRDEVADELDERLRRLELGHASVISGTKDQIRRTRHAAWIVWVFLLVIFGILVIQAHDLHITECMLKPVHNPVQAYICDAAFPLHGHESMHDVIVPGASGAQTWHYAVAPQLAGGIFYLLLIGGLIYGIVLYRRSSEQESQVQAGHVPENVLEKMAAAQEQAITQSREDAEHHGSTDV